MPTSSPHHADISWAVDNHITQGCNDGTYRPTDPVSRQAMATFLHRLSNEFEVLAEPWSYGGVGSSYTASANCEPSQRALAGGATSYSATAYITDSYPSADTWYVRFQMEDFANIAGASGNVYVLCGPSA